MVFLCFPKGYFQDLEKLLNKLCSASVSTSSFLLSPQSAPNVQFHKISIPPPQKGQDFFEDPSIPIKIPVKLINFFNIFGLPEPLTPQEIPLPSVGGGGGSTDIFWNCTIPVHFLFGKINSQN